MSRLYVHLSKDKETALMTGKRHGRPVVYVVRSGEMARDGYTFYQSVNDVWLIKHVPPIYLSKK
ncbi:MAG: RNA 2'-phosphotransferase, partial [Erysipelotrichaceae bacterium]|nr:RNA 2'-phosphotransferase [Erysipelotrichaceae bacterium]